MQQEGKYIYCVVETEQERNYGPVGVGAHGDEVLSIGYDDLSMVVSNCPVAGCAASRENLIAHQRVIEQMMGEFDSVLPVRFGTIASGADEVRNLLDRRRREFKRRLADMDHKVELGVKGFWRDMGVVYEELLRENPVSEAAERDAGRKAATGTSGPESSSDAWSRRRSKRRNKRWPRRSSSACVRSVVRTSR